MQGKTALITGVTGQDGALLARFLLKKGYTVHGLRPYSATDDTGRLKDCLTNPHFHLHHADLTDSGSLYALLGALQPDEVYNLGAQSHVQVSFANAESTSNINALGPLRLLEGLRVLNLKDKTRFYQASSSEMFGTSAPPQNENTPFHPCSPYGAAKLYAYWTVRQYREAYGMHASNGILFNHESPVRGEEFVTRKITQTVVAIEAGRQRNLRLGNLDARRDWGHAEDYVEGMWLMLQQDAPDDYVLATGKSYTVREFTEAAFACAGMRLRWEGEGLEEKGIDARSGRVLVSIDPELFRPNEVHALLGDASKARDLLGWTPKRGFGGLVQDMIAADRIALSEGALSPAPEEEAKAFLSAV